MRDVVIFNAWPSHAVKAELQCRLARFARILKSASSEDIVIEIKGFGHDHFELAAAVSFQQNMTFGQNASQKVNLNFVT